MWPPVRYLHRNRSASSQRLRSIESVSASSRQTPALGRSADSLFDQRDQRTDAARRDHARAGVDREPREAVLLRQDALHHRQEPLQIQLLVEGDRDVSLLQTIDRGRGQVDTADRDLARLPSRILERLADERGDVCAGGGECGIGKISPPPTYLRAWSLSRSALQNRPSRDASPAHGTMVTACSALKNPDGKASSARKGGSQFTLGNGRALNR